MSYHHSKFVEYGFEEAMTKTKAVLTDKGFGIITEIDLKEKFKEKLNVDFREYRILGACTPKLVYEAISKEDKIGVLLPCNVLIQQHADGKVEVTAVNPTETMSAVKNANLKPLAAEVGSKLKEAIDLM
jgi:uncharacterized protein (DUF302 family)